MRTFFWFLYKTDRAVGAGFDKACVLGGGRGSGVFLIYATSSMCMRAHRIVNSASCGYNGIKRNFA